MNKTAILVLIAILAIPAVRRTAGPSGPSGPSGPISLYRDVADLVTYAKKAKEAFKVLAQTLSGSSDQRSDGPQVPPEWAFGASLYFCEPNSEAESYANKEYRSGRKVFRIHPKRQDLYKAFGATVDTIITVSPTGVTKRWRFKRDQCTTGVCP